MKKYNWFLIIIVFMAMLCMLNTLFADVTAIKAGKLVDPEKGIVHENQILLIEGGRIKAIGSDIDVPPEALIIDLSRNTVLPGLFDCHTHVCISIPSGRFLGTMSEKERRHVRRLLGNVGLHYSINTTTAFRALQGAKNAREMLESGFTTIREAGGAGNYADTDLRRAIEQGYLPGPTIVNCGRIISPVGGQFTYGLHPERPGQGEPEFYYADTKDEMKKAIRSNILYGVKAIKIIADDQPYIYSVEDIEFIKEEAERAGLKVLAHSGVETGAYNCAKAGIASIEHGFKMSDKTLELAKKNNVVLVGTDFTEEYWKEYGMPGEEAKRWNAGLLDRIRRAYKIGTIMAFGSDVILDVLDKTRGEVCMSMMDSYINAGLPAEYILKMMTTNAAKLLGVENERGLLRKDMAADIIAVSENPLDNIQSLKQVLFVMKDGRVHKYDKCLHSLHANAE